MAGYGLILLFYLYGFDGLTRLQQNSIKAVSAHIPYLGLVSWIHMFSLFDCILMEILTLNRHFMSRHIEVNSKAFRTSQMRPNNPSITVLWHIQL